MAKQTDTSEAPRRPTWIAVAAGAALILVAGVWWSFDQETAPPGSPAAVVLAKADGSRFRSDAWYLPATDTLGFVEIPAGPVTIGSDPARDSLAFDNERWSPAAPQGTVNLPAFYIGQYEVTVAQYAAFVAATGHAADARVFSAPPDHPAAWVSWPDAVAYCAWLDANLRTWSGTPAALKRFLDEGGTVTLPQEVEWEKAARGTDGRIFPWGDRPRRDRANVGSQATAPVGSFACPECAFPLFDMAGNVWEWTLSPFQPYPFNPADDRTGLQSDALWVMRGGSFTDVERNLRSATRGGADPGARRPFIGFRVAVAARN